MVAAVVLAVVALAAFSLLGAATAAADPIATVPTAAVPAASAPAAVGPARGGIANDLYLSRRGIGLDLDLAGGARVHAGAGDVTRSWFARARAGVLVFDEPSFWSLGVAGQLGPLASSSLGVELAYGEVLYGVTAQAGVFPLDTTGGTVVEAQLGWTVFAAEYQRRVSGPRDGDQALVFAVHAPLGIIYQMLRTPPGVVEHRAR
ncbi:MAG: hypothetical protein ABI437_20430 [Kofleriaceae bacterium]